MTTNGELEMILPKERFHGKLINNGKAISINLVASIDATGYIEMNVDPFLIPPSSIPLVSPNWLYKSGEINTTKIILDCKSESGTILYSDSITITNYQERSEKTTVSKSH